MFAFFKMRYLLKNLNVVVSNIVFFKDESKF